MMDISEKIQVLRRERGFSQETLAERLGVSRQAVSRWETGTALPDARNILALSKLFDVTTDFLLDDGRETDETLPRAREDRTILHGNLTRLAIIAQAAFLNTVARPWDGDGADRTLEMLLKILPLLAASVWMASNHRYEKDLAQRARNVKIELVYCLLQAAAAVAGYFFRLGWLATWLILALALVYLLLINPKYMNRKFARRKK